MIHCLFHRDNDGRCAGAIVGKKFGIEHINWVQMSYGNIPPWNDIKKDDIVIIVDFSLQIKGQWEQLLNITKDVIWIDHHKSAIERDDSPHHLNGLRIDGTAGAQLTWNYFFPNEKTPIIVQNISDYDIWKFELKHTLVINQGLYARNCHPSSNLWKILLDSKYNDQILLNDIIHDGTIIQEYNNKIWSGIIYHQSYYINFEGYKAIVCNNRGPSLMFDSIDTNTFEIMIWWYYNGKNYEYRVCTKRDDIDVSIICKKYGGGGHKMIGGFQHPTLFKQIIENKIEVNLN